MGKRRTRTRKSKRNRIEGNVPLENTWLWIFGSWSVTDSIPFGPLFLRFNFSSLSRLCWDPDADEMWRCDPPTICLRYLRVAVAEKTTDLFNWHASGVMPTGLVVAQKGSFRPAKSFSVFFFLIPWNSYWSELSWFVFYLSASFIFEARMFSSRLAVSGILLDLTLSFSLLSLLFLLFHIHLCHLFYLCVCVRLETQSAEMTNSAISTWPSVKWAYLEFDSCDSV